MALIHISLFSKALRKETSVNVVIPNVCDADPSRQIYEFDQDFPVLYLLHGAGGTYSDWIRHTCVEDLAGKYQTAVVMPSVDLSFYTDMISGGRYFTYISSELPEYLKRILPISDRREQCCVAGLSMGGFGAVKLALSFPERYRAAASMSGVLDAEGLMRNEELTKQIELDQVMQWCFGTADQITGTKNDLLYLLQEAKKRNCDLPAIYQCVGTEDFLYEINQNFRERAEKTGIPLLYSEDEGEHDWNYWRAHLTKVFDWLYGENVYGKSCV